MKPIPSDFSLKRQLDAIRRSLVETTDLKGIIGLHRQVVAIENRLKNADFGRQIEIETAELKLLIERKGGNVLPDLRLRGGNHLPTHAAGKLTLQQLGISKKESAEWQMEALLPDEDFASYIARSASEGKKPSSHGLFRLASEYVESSKLANNGEDPITRVARGLRSRAHAGNRFARIYVEIPTGPVGCGRASGSICGAALAQLPLVEVAAPESHLYLKIAPQSPQVGVKILDAWGFPLKTRLSRVQAPLEADSPFLPVYESWLLGVRHESGSPICGLPPWMHRVDVFAFQSTADIHHIIEGLSVEGWGGPPYLDLFASQSFSEDWTLAVP